MSRRIGLPASALVLCLMLGWASSSVADPPGTVITSCSYAALQDAVAGGGSIELQCGSQPTTISFPSPIVVGPTGNASITVASGQSVTLDGGGKSQIFKVEGGTLSLSHLKLSNGMALGTAGTAGPPGPAGSAGDEGESGEGGEEGQPGENGEEGGDGEDGEDGEKGSEGGEAQGGAIYIAAGSAVKISSSTFATDHAVGGAGGKGGNGGKGGAGGSGGDGGDGGGILGSQGLPGGTGGDGGDGGKGGDGGDGGDGGNAEGGAIYNAGTLEVSATKFNAGDYAQGGKGGGGGSGGRGSDAGDGGKGGRGGDAGAEGAHGADGAEPGRGGDTGAPGGGGGGGDGGEAFGGAIFNAASGSLEVLEGTSFTGDLAQGGAAGGGGGGGAGGGGASGGEGGWGGGGLNGGGETATTGGNGADGKDGGDGDTGADGGDGGGGGAAKGGAIASENSELTLDGSTTYSSNAALGGAAGSGGSGGEGGDGRSGGGGGWAGAAQCGFHEGKCASPGHSGRAGSGGNGGDGGDGGNGGAGSLTGGEAHGDDVYTPAGGSGGTQGPGGAGGAGGKPGSGGEAGRAGFGGGSEGGSDTEIIGGGEGSEGEAGEEGEPGTAGIGANVSPVPAPLLSATSPGSPSNKTTIKVLGSAEAGSAILVYANASCAGTPIGGGTAANLESPGILVLVPPNSTTLLYATATDDKGTSACSSPGLPFVQDSVPPETTIASGPAEGSTTNEATPSFALASSEEKSKFECALDGAEFASCKSPFKTPALSVGAHTLSVRAIDAAGNTDPTPAKRSFSYKPAGEQPHPSSPRPPKIGKHPGPKIETSGKKAKVKFSFVAHGSGTKYKCSLDNAPFRPCTSPVTYEVKPGKHSFRVEAIEAGAKPSKATSWKFTVAHKG